MNNSERPIIAVITAVASQTAQKELMHGIFEQAQASGYDTAVFSNIYNMSQTDENLIFEQRIYNLILSDQISALIVDSEAFVNSLLIQDLSDLILQKNIPVIVLGEQLKYLNNPNFFHINTSDTNDLEMLTDHLIEEHGYKKIDILTGHMGNMASENRLEGYRNSLLKHGILPEENNYFYGDFWMISGAALAKRYISGEIKLPEAIVCANDCMAFGLMRTFRHNNIKVPSDVAVVGYELSDRRIYYSPLLTVYKRNLRLLGKKAVMYIQSLLSGTQMPDLSQISGELICGESCPCHANMEIYHEQLEYALDMKDYESNVLFSTMEQKLTASRNLDEFAAVMGEFQWMIRYVQDVFLCLYTDWYDNHPAVSSIVSCRSIIPWLDNASFEAHKFDFAAIFRRETDPSVYYFTPLFFCNRLFGHLVLKYNKPDSYDEAFRSWVKSVSVGLEFLRMKNDIQYLLSCQDLSDSRDTLTGMYNKHGIRQAFRNSAAHDNKELCFIMLCICINSSSFATEGEHKVNALLSASKAVHEFCGNHDVSGYMGDQKFICLVHSNADIGLLCSTLNAILMQHKEYINVFGTDSVFCTGEFCGDKDFEELYEKCLTRAELYQSQTEKKHSMRHYNEMLAFRNRIYTSPELTFSQELYPDNINSMRMMYKRCFDISFHQDCINARIAKAKYYLATTSLSLIDTAEKCGYIDHKYFQRQFTANVGITARQFRNLMKT